jgi:predicted hotdog family 3-hydroxylacyl-ACP dehydratase
MIDSRLIQLIPHRPPMLLLTRLVNVENSMSCAEVDIKATSPFCEPEKGVPSWIGVEYMGQTAALIAGFQLEQGTVEPHLGLLLGTRKYQATSPWFPLDSTLLVECVEVAVVGQNLATFACEIHNKHSGDLYASAKLSVFRRPLQTDSYIKV